MAALSVIAARWQLALGIAGLLILTHGLAYCVGTGDGRAAVKIDLREKQVEAKIESLERVKEGDIAGAKRAEAFAADQAEAVKAIEQAEAENTNALDSLF